MTRLGVLPGAGLCLGLLSAACGDPLLPADFAGPPAAQVEGTVVGAPGVSPDVDRPRVSMEWLSAPSAAAFSPGEAGRPVGQPVALRRSSRLETDWDLGLELPNETARIEAQVPGPRGTIRKVSLSVGKLVYFNDRVADGRLDWSCVGQPCDEVKALSTEIIVHVENPPLCTPKLGGPARPRLAPGFHYFRLEDGRPVLVDGVPVTFELIPPADRITASDPTAVLRDFTRALLWSWSLAAVDGC